MLLRAAAPGLNVRTPWLCLVTRENGMARPFGYSRALRAIATVTSLEGWNVYNAHTHVAYRSG